MDCKEFRDIVADLFDRDVEPRTKAECEQHISQCAECKEYYEELRQTAELLCPKHSPVNPARHHHRSSYPLQKIAAIFLAAAFLGGLAWTINPLLTSPKEKAPQSAEVTTLPFEGERGGGLLLFADVRLDSMLAIVSQHYGKAVFFGDEELKALHIHTKWNREDSLAAFIENLNELDGLSLTEQRDTIFVQKGGAQ